MNYSWLGRFLLSTALSGFAAPLDAGEARLPTDANLVTAIDVSGSIGPRGEALQFDGIAEAVLDPAFLQTVAAGYHRRVGFAAFTWSSQGDFVPLVPWTLIESGVTASEIATRLRTALGKPRFAYSAPSPGLAARAWRQSLATDVSKAIEHATSLLAKAPFDPVREVINILANGTDNIAEGPAAARDHALARGVVINGLVLADDAELAAYFRAHVQGGPGSFVLAAQRPADIASALLKKFLMDLVAMPPQVTTRSRG